MHLWLSLHFFVLKTLLNFGYQAVKRRSSRQTCKFEFPANLQLWQQISSLLPDFCGFTCYLRWLKHCLIPINGRSPWDSSDAEGKLFFNFSFCFVLLNFILKASCIFCFTLCSFVLCEAGLSQLVQDIIYFKVL